MDLNNNTTNNNDQQHQSEHQQQSQQQPPVFIEQQQPNKQQQPIQQKIKANPTFDWLANFPISDDMKDKSQLQTELSQKIFNFTKTYLFDFYPSTEIKPKPLNNLPLKLVFTILFARWLVTDLNF